MEQIFSLLNKNRQAPGDGLFSVEARAKTMSMKFILLLKEAL
jgi:hypothetical protein